MICLLRHTETEAAEAGSERPCGIPSVKWIVRFAGRKSETAVGLIPVAVCGKAAHQSVTECLGSVRNRVRLVRRILGTGRVAKECGERIAKRAAVARNAQSRSVGCDLQILA